jgi:hypothetical protein
MSVCRTAISRSAANEQTADDDASPLQIPPMADSTPLPRTFSAMSRHPIPVYAAS